MAIAGNIETVMALRETASSCILLPSELKRWFPSCPKTFAGFNFYYGINQVNVNAYQCSGRTEALNLRHQSLLNACVKELLASASSCLTLNLSLEPLEPTLPYAYVAQHMDLVSRLATELAGLQEKVGAASNGEKVLRFLVRYASEMNETAPTNHYAGNPAAFIESFRAVRAAFAAAAPAIPFAFSPAIRKDLKEENVAPYWPGADVVDIISCTWYIGEEDQFDGAVDFFRSYFRHHQAAGKPLGIDEFGGCETLFRDTPQETGQLNDDFLQRMSAVIQELGSEGIAFDYATIFLDAKWGADATLTWV